MALMKTILEIWLPASMIMDEATNKMKPAKGADVCTFEILEDVKIFSVRLISPPICLKLATLPPTLVGALDEK